MQKNIVKPLEEADFSRERSVRISEIRSFYFKGNFEGFASKLGVSSRYASVLCNNKQVITEKTLEKILDAFPDVSRSWLYSGEGSMFVDNSGDFSNNHVGGDLLGNGATKTSGDEVKALIEAVSRLTAVNQTQTEQISTLINMLNEKR